MADHNQYYDDGTQQSQYGENNNQNEVQYGENRQGQQVGCEDGKYAYDDDQDNQTEMDYSATPDIMLLNDYCANAHSPSYLPKDAKHEAEQSWELVREWLRTHSAGEVRSGAQQRGDSAMTALHFACRNSPVTDVINVLLSVAIDTAQWKDSFGWLPIHYACACGADPQAIKALAEAFPESKTTVDRRGRTPLHFALGNSNPDSPVSPAVVILLSSTGAATYPDDTGMLPLHYACAYGASEAVLYVLTDAYDGGITTLDRLGRTPLHYTLSNAGRKSAPSAVRLLLSLHKKNASKTGVSLPPLKVLAEYSANVNREEVAQRDSVLRCLEHLLSFDPDPTADFFFALQSLPDWLQERAVVMPTVQVLLNEKIAQRFPTGVLLSDIFVQLVVIISYGIAVPLSVDRRFRDSEYHMEVGYLIPLYIGATYFLLRTCVQILSLVALGSFHVWVKHPSNWLDTVYICMVYFWSIRMSEGTGDPENFRAGAAVSAVVLWMKLLAYLRNTYIDFAVLLGGLFYVVRRLVAFLLCLCITLIAFSQMFYTLFHQGERCRNQPNDSSEQRNLISDLQCEENAIEVYCNRWDAFLNTFTMLLGEVDDEQFKGEPFAVALFIVFMFLVVILLANVLIAIVTDSYKVIQDQRAAIVFWTDRLDFIAEMDAIANFLRQMTGSTTEDSRIKVTFGRASWKALMDLYEDDIDERAFSLEFIFITLLRFGTAIVIPCWLLFGLLTFGCLWPPQIREAVFTSQVLKHSSDLEKEKEMRRVQVNIVRQEVRILKDDLMQELAVYRIQVVQMKSLVAERKQEIQGEMKEIKRVVALLFEQQSLM